MFQTDSAAAILPGPAMDKASGKGGKPADDSGAFSQEFEKQVKKSGNTAGEPARQGTSAEQGKTPEKTTEKAENTETAAERSASADAGKTEAGQKKTAAGKEEAAQSGKKLPHRLAAAEKSDAAVKDAAKAEIPPSEVIDSVDEAEFESAEPATAQLAALAEKKDKSVSEPVKGQKAKQKEQDMSSSVLPVFVAQSPASDGLHTEETEATADSEALVRDVHVRDVLAQRMMGGSSQGKGVFAGKGKADIANLATLQGGQGRASQGGFDEMLKMGVTSSVSTIPQGVAAPTVPQPAAASVAVTMTLAMPLQQQGWDKAMAERVVWMARGNIQQAQLQLNPRELGPIDIKITMQHDQAHVNFVAHHVATRDAIEAAIPRLRDMMNEQGMNLGQADVSHHSFGDGSRQAANANGGHGNGIAGAGGMEDERVDETPLTHHIGHVSASGVDYFA